MNKRLYAAYGRGTSSEYLNGLCQNAKPIAKSWLHEHRLVFQGMQNAALATVIPEEGYSVPLVIWEISAQDEAKLDRLNGVHMGFLEKEYIEVEVDGEMKQVFIYHMKPNPFGTPTYGEFRIIQKGYSEFGFEEEILKEALAYSYQNSIIYETNEEE